MTAIGINMENALENVELENFTDSENNSQWILRHFAFNVSECILFDIVACVSSQENFQENFQSLASPNTLSQTSETKAMLSVRRIEIKN